MVSLKEFFCNFCSEQDVIKVETLSSNIPVEGTVFTLREDKVGIDEIRPCGDIVFVSFADIASVCNHSTGTKWPES